ncbi:MAG: hypothetical protein ACXWUN_06755, partial [Allosphingosinicella sp.]
MDFDARLQRLQERLGHSLPSEYVNFITRHHSTSEDGPWVVSTNPDFWGVRHVFELGEGASYYQVD